MMFAARRRKAAESLIQTGWGRKIRVHSVTPQPSELKEGQKPKYLRVAFEFVDPPGPYTLQFYEATADQPEVSGKLEPGTEAFFYESEDEARVRVLKTADGEGLFPR